MSRKIVHMAQSIEGALKNYTPKEFERHFRDAFTDSKGQLIHPRVGRQLLEKKFAAGERLLPVGSCEGFDPVTGCPGHPDPAAPDCMECPGCSVCRAPD